MPRLTISEDEPPGGRRTSLLYNPDRGFEVNDLPKSYKGIFKAAGIKKTDLKDREHASKIFEAIRSVSPSVVGDDRPLPTSEEKRTGPRSAIVRRPHPPTLKKKKSRKTAEEIASPPEDPSPPPSPSPGAPLRAQTVPISASSKASQSSPPSVPVDVLEHPSVFPPSEEIRAGTPLQHVQKVVDIKEVSSVSAPSLVGRLKSLVFRAPSTPTIALFGVDDGEDWSSDDYTLYEGR